MKTILYNTINKVPLKHASGQVKTFNGGFYVDGEKPNYAGIVELEIEQATPPAYDSSTHKLVHHDFEADLPNGKWKDSYTTEPLTSYELAAREWIAPDCPQRIVAPESLILESVGAGFYNILVHEKKCTKTYENGVFHIYIKQVDVGHKQVMDSLELQNKITVETRPTILDPA